MRLLLAACVAALVPAAVNAQTLYKCVLNGKTVYQAEACPEEAKQHTLQAPKAGPTKSPAAQAAEDTQTGLEIVSGFRACSDGVPEWGATNKAGYDAWRASNAALVTRIENEPALQERYRERMQTTRYGTPEMCSKIAALIPAPATPRK